MGANIKVSGFSDNANKLRAGSAEQWVLKIINRHYECEYQQC